mmetsp:Transcript_23838/g.20805  ORF Transcript_23838/g.20805 Transcript_23838/m.20805 type:complete len:235 (+) Transcript_23838:64-768(+)
MFANSKTGKCQLCDEQCKSCFGADSDSCYACSFDYVFQSPSSCVSFGTPQPWEADGNGWTIPKDGDNVIVAKDQVVMISQDTAAIDTLIIDGTLYINPDVNSSITLSAQRIFVREGNFHCNISQNENITFTLLLSSSNTPYTVNDTFNLTNQDLNFQDKSIVILGQINFAGVQKSPAVRLAQSVGPGDQSIFVDGSTDGWDSGDKILLASSSFEIDEFEILTVTDIVGNEIALD